jgi:hypothetical protein
MFSPIRSNAQFTEFWMIVDPQPEGATIGYFAGKPISEGVIDIFGRRFTYVGAASRRPDGEFDVGQLKAGEFIAAPGLVYRLAHESARRAA